MEVKDERGIRSALEFEYDPLQLVNSILKSPCDSYMMLLFSSVRASGFRLILTEPADAKMLVFSEIELYRQLNSGKYE